MQYPYPIVHKTAHQVGSILKKMIKWILNVWSILVGYSLASLLPSAISIDKIDEEAICDKTIFLCTNGVHLEITVPIKDVDSTLLSQTMKEPKYGCQTKDTPTMTIFIPNLM